LALEKCSGKREAQKTMIEILLLRRAYSEESWRHALERLIKMKRIRSEELKALLKLEQEDDIHDSLREEMKEHVRQKMSHLEMEDIECNTDLYNTLCGEEASC
jgi:flagellin-specific chaperone FliS